VREGDTRGSTQDKSAEGLRIKSHALGYASRADVIPQHRCNVGEGTRPASPAAASLACIHSCAGLGWAACYQGQEALRLRRTRLPQLSFSVDIPASKCGQV